jgi:predicted metalloprotease with PDZ domain
MRLALSISSRRKAKRFKDWRVATALTPAQAGGDRRGKAKRHGFGLYRAENYDELIDHPVEMGRFTTATFEACGVPHDIAITGRHDCDMSACAADLKRICEWQIRFFGEPAPMSRYVFLVTAVGDGYGGLEHRASTALLCSAQRPALRRHERLPEGYRTFLGLCSHEYFHTWNVKRIKPAAFTPYDLEPRELHDAAVGLRGLHLVLRRPGPGAQRRYRTRGLARAAGQDDQQRAQARPAA